MMKKVFFITWAVLAIFACNLAFAQTGYVVKQGDSLSKIANKFYNDPSKWTYIYRANKDLIEDAESIQIGWNLKIPPIDDSKINTEEDSPQDIIRLVTGNNYLPFTDKKLPGGGMLTEIIVRVFEDEKMGKKVEVDYWSWKHGYDATKQGEFLATFPYVWDPEREKDFYFSCNSLYNISLYGFVKKDSSIKYEVPQDLKGLTICRPEGYTTSYLDEFFNDGILTLKQPKEMINCFRLLKQGKVDIVSTDEFEATAIMIKEFGSSEYFKMLNKTFSEGHLYLMFPKSKPGNLNLLYEFDQVFNKLLKDGTLQKIIKRHLKYYQLLLQE
ncbi:MAG: transporter substrate-binding domain-containing protein [Desulfobacterales bacterium]|nr:transporter substrate-binding domain-containing protein [Desulfobacterales bacterium]